MGYGLTWREMSYDFKLMYIYFVGIIVTFPVGMVLFMDYGQAVSAVFDISVAGILATVVVLLSRRHRRLVDWRWRRPGRRGMLAALAIVAAVAAFFALVALLFPLPIWRPPLLPFLLFGVGIGVFSVLKALGIVAIREVELLDPPDPSLAAVKTPLSRRAWALKLSACALLLLGCVGWFGGALTSLLKPAWISSETQLPLGDLESVALDSQGRIYCGLAFYSRIQVYDEQGRFLRGWWVDGGGGMLRLHMAEGDRLEVEAARKNRVFTFDLNGSLIESNQQTETQRKVSDRLDQLPVTDARGRTYAIRNRFFWPHVVREDQAGRTTVVSTPWYLWPIMGPLPAWIFFAIGLVTLGLTSVRRQQLIARGRRA